MLVGVISDTHGWLHPDVADVFAGCDIILHAGDIGTVAVLDEIEMIGPPVKAVYGNVDGWDIRHRAPEYQRLELGGLRVLMTHIGGRPGRWERQVARELRSYTPHVFICGHSHILRIERVPDLAGMLYLNPGAAGRQGFHQVKTCMRIEIDGGIAKQAEVIHLS